MHSNLNVSSPLESMLIVINASENWFKKAEFLTENDEKFRLEQKDFEQVLEFLAKY